MQHVEKRWCRDNNARVKSNIICYAWRLDCHCFVRVRVKTQARTEIAFHNGWWFIINNFTKRFSHREQIFNNLSFGANHIATYYRIIDWLARLLRIVYLLCYKFCHAVEEYKSTISCTNYFLTASNNKSRKSKKDDIINIEKSLSTMVRTTVFPLNGFEKRNRENNKLE